MNQAAQLRFVRVISGEAGGVAPAVIRGGLAAIEPLYAVAVALRNRMYDRPARVARLPKPVISVGNLTTGGTGKTPVAAWLARRLAGQFRSIAVLTRGYKADRHGRSDEAELLRRQLGASARVVVGADRFRAASDALARAPDIDLFIMDDGFQHRRLHRDFDLVLIDATNPFGFGRLLPRGLLREPPQSLRRASAILITRSDEVDMRQLAEVEQRCRQHSAAPVFRCRHELTSLSISGKGQPITALAGKRIVAFAGIGNPASFAQLLERAGAVVVSRRWFPDHHNYTQADVDELRALLAHCQAELLVTTAKDAARCALPLSPLVVAEMSVEFDPPVELRLLELIRRAVGPTAP